MSWLRRKEVVVSADRTGLHYVLCLSLSTSLPEKNCKDDNEDGEGAASCVAVSIANRRSADGEANLPSPGSLAWLGFVTVSNVLEVVGRCCSITLQPIIDRASVGSDPHLLCKIPWCKNRLDWHVRPVRRPDVRVLLQSDIHRGKGPRNQKVRPFRGDAQPQLRNRFRDVDAVPDERQRSASRRSHDLTSVGRHSYGCPVYAGGTGFGPGRSAINGNAHFGSGRVNSESRQNHQAVSISGQCYRN